MGQLSRNMFKSRRTSGKIPISQLPRITTDMIRKMAFGLVFGSAAAGAIAQAPDIKARPDSAYIQDSRGTIARSQSGLCWRTGYWTPADAVPGCDGELVPPITRPTAPAIAMPAAAAAAAPAAPIPPAAPPAPPARCDFAVTLDSDQAFAFNHADLSNAAKKRIDNEVLPKLASCATIDSIMVTGHADRLGSHQYNQRLSEKRAAVVAGYLKRNGATGPIDTLGVGKTQSFNACDDKLPRPKLVACLASDRRVVIEARGKAK
jgi:OOP family OmpA-OmpF porin